jgi:hypothetical protein
VIAHKVLTEAFPDIDDVLSEAIEPSGLRGGGSWTTSWWPSRSPIDGFGQHLDIRRSVGATTARVNNARTIGIAITEHSRAITWSASQLGVETAPLVRIMRAIALP